MIELQPEVLRQVAGFDVGPQADILKPARRLFIVGTGTSFHAAELGAFLLSQHGIDAIAVRSANAARWRPAVVEGDGFVVISHTGETAYARTVRAALQAQGAPLVTITGEHAGWEEAIATPTHERSETYTVSYTAALAVIGLLAHALTGSGTGADALYGVADQVEAVIAEPAIEHIEVPARALAIVGPGVWGVTAREGALKIRESAHILAEGFDAETLLHGYAVPYGEEDTLVVLQPESDADELTAGLGLAAAAEGMKVHVLGAGFGGGGAAQTYMAQIPATVLLQLLASQLTDAKGTDPDTAITGAWARTELWSAGGPPE